MKKISQVIVLLLGICFALGAQVPQYFNYQATLRDNAGQLLASKSVSLRISILQNSTSGIPVYWETHQTTTTNLGIINAQIGKGTSSNNIDNIDWAQGPYFVKIEVDQNGGSNYITLGTSELTSVPYALQAKNAEAINWENVKNKPVSATVATSGSYADLLDKPVIPTNTNQLTNGAGFITTYNETDPVFTSSPANQVTTNMISNWNTAYGWGNHAWAGYATYPSQSGNAGKFLTTNGTSPAWAYAITLANSPLSISNNTIGITKASSTSNGFLSSADWNTFNNKAPSPWSLNGSDIYYNGGNVGIGTTSPLNKLSIVGNEEEWPGRILLSIRNQNTGPKSLAYLKIYTGSGEAGTSLGHIATTYTANASPSEIAGYGILASSDNGMIISATKPDLSPGIIKFFNGQTPDTKFIETMRISENGNIGIGTTNPVSKLNIVGVAESGSERNLLQLKNNTNNGLSYTGISLQTGSSNGHSVIQDYGSTYNASTSYDFAGFLNVSNNNRGVMLHANSSEGVIKFYTGHDNMMGAGVERMRIDQNGNIGIGTANPIAKLNIIGNVDEGDERALIRLKNNSTGPKATVSIALQSFENKGVALGYASSNYSMNDLADFGSITTNGRGLAFVANYGQIRFYTNKNEDNTYSEKLRINEEGNVGIGTTTPNAKLEVADGDVYIKDINKGIIMTSPDGQCWRGTINNSGVLEFTAITCP